MDLQKHIRNRLETAIAKSGFDTAVEDHILVLEKPKQENFGDISTPVAMNLAPAVKQAPRQIAQRIVDQFDIDPYYIEKIELAGPGFINFFLSKKCLQNAVAQIIKEGPTYGRSDLHKGESAQFEFVSANPTGPLNIVSARAAAVGDVLSNLRAAIGVEVEREFYVNDAGRQIRLLGASLNSRYMTELGYDEPVPEDGYHGHYLQELAVELVQNEGDTYAALDKEKRFEALSRLALEEMLKRQKKSLEHYRLQFDNWYRESRLRREKAHLKLLDLFNKKKLAYEKDGAIWFRSSDFGDEKDRVLVTREGEPTYFLVDIAYHQTKYERRFDKVYDIWGPDHHGYIGRMRAAMQALGHGKESFEVIIVQQVNLFRGGKVVKMSKRAGEIIEMDELIDEVGVDAARYFFADRRLSQPLDFDIDLAKKQSDENPVYYVQYAHARICNVLRFAREKELAPDQESLSLLNNDSELSLIKKVIDYVDLVEKAALNLEPHRLTNYLHELATVFHKFYHDNRVVSDDVALSGARLALVTAARQVFANGLEILGVSAPENM
jgi:arginyl-tRNA synthetase